MKPNRTESIVQTSRRVSSSALSLLTIVVPAFNINQHKENLLSWISSPIINECQKIVIHDSSDGNDSTDFERSISSISEMLFIKSNCNSPGAARNLGIESSNRDWIVFWDADDQPQLDKFKEVFNQLVEKTNSIGVASYEVRDQEDFIKSSRILCSHTVQGSNRDLMVNPGIWSWIFRRSFIGLTRFSNLKRGEDQLFLANLNVFDESIQKFPQVIYIHKTGHSGRLTTNLKLSPQLLTAAEALARVGATARTKTKKYCSFESTLSLLVFLTEFRHARNSNLSVPLSKKNFALLARHIWYLPRTLYLFVQSRKRARHHKSSFLTIYLSGGLGNQLFQLSFATHGNVFSNIELLNVHRDLKIALDDGLYTAISLKARRDITWQARTTSWIETKLNNYFLRNQTSKLMEKSFFRNLFSFLIKAFYFIKFKKKIELVLPTGIGFNPELLEFCPFGNKHAIGYFQSYIWAGPLRGVLTEYLTRLPESLKKISLLEELELAHGKLVGVQVRLGDYMKASNSSLGHVTSSYLTRAIERATDDSEAKILVFSDSMRLALSLLPEKFRRTSIQVPEDFTTWENLFLMSRIGNLVISNSTFGWWGAFLGEDTEGKKILPSPWFKDLDEPLKLIPENWIQIELEE